MIFYSISEFNHKMGASCSGTKATEVQDSVNKITLNAQAKEHLKSLNPNATIGKLHSNDKQRCIKSMRNRYINL